MKKLLLLFYALLLFNTNIYSIDKKISEELEKQEIAEKGYQTVNKLKSTYKERKWDGYSKINTTKMTKKCQK